MNAVQGPSDRGAILSQGAASQSAAGGRCAFSVIVPALDEENVIGRCLEALARMDYPRDDFEVILVDNGSTDRTVEIAESFQSSLNLSILQKRNVHISALRNFGAAAAQGDVLAFLDADCLAPADWLSRAAALFRTEGGGVMGAPYLIPGDSTWVARCWYAREQQKKKRGPVSYVPGGDLLVSREDFSRVGGFDETLETNEDYEFCQRMIAAGCSVRAFPEIAVVHLGTPQTLGAFYRKQRWHGTHVFRVFLRDISRMRNAKPVFFAFYTLLCLAGVALGAVAAAVFGRWEVLAASLAAMLAAALALGSREAAPPRSWSGVLRLALMFLTFGIARAACLLDFKTASMKAIPLPAGKMHE